MIQYRILASKWIKRKGVKNMINVYNVKKEGQEKKEGRFI